MSVYADPMPIAPCVANWPVGQTVAVVMGSFNFTSEEGISMLVGVPAPQPLESPSSWISRAALSQAVRVRVLMDFLEIPALRDLDFVFASQERTRKIARKCKFDPQVFWPMRHMFQSLRSFDRAATFLLRQGEFPRTRYCSECLKEQRCAYMPLEWRFKAYRWCPTHQTLLRDRCPACSAPVVLPADLILAGQSGRRAQLNFCMACGERLSNKITDGTRFSGTRRFLTAWEQRLLQNGAAVIAALAHRKVWVVTREYEKPLSYLRKLERGGHIAHQHFRYESLDRPYVKYRHPWTGALVDVARPPRPRVPVAVEERWHGLFDGYLS